MDRMSVEKVNQAIRDNYSGKPVGKGGQDWHRPRPELEKHMKYTAEGSFARIAVYEESIATTKVRHETLTKVMFTKLLRFVVATCMSFPSWVKFVG